MRTPEDFGSQGNNPTHPELLDWLARDFVSHGWDLHRLLRQMVLSATYRQSTFGNVASMEKDPENLTFCRSNPNRLAAEMIRDNALAVSGLLVDEVEDRLSSPTKLRRHSSPWNRMRAKACIEEAYTLFGSEILLLR